MKSQTVFSARQSSLLYWTSRSFNAGSWLAFQVSRRIMLWMPDASLSVHRRFADWLGVEARPVQPEQLALPPNAQGRVTGIDQVSFVLT
jgi:hypothetical protein